jgi:hypothetical protein
MPALARRMRMDVHEQTRLQSRPPGQQARGQVQRHAVDVLAQQRTQPDIAPSHERQRSQEMPAELPVRAQGSLSRYALNESVSMRTGCPCANWML